MKRIVLDTNVIVSGVVFGGVPEHILESVHARTVVAVTSSALIEELLRTLRQKFSFGDEALAVIQRRISRAFTVVVPQERLHVLSDEADNRVLEAAVEGNCEMIVTGDKEFLKLLLFRDIAILSLRAFCELSELRFEKT